MTIEYYDGSGSAFRKIEALEVSEVQGIATVNKAKVSNLIDGSYTLMEFKKMKYNLGIPENIFNERTLRNPPRQWLKGR